MEQGKPIVQKIRKNYPDSLEVAIKYYGLISVLNSIHLTKREIELLAFTAVNGSISAGGAREGFVKRFKSSKATVNNMISDLQEIGLLVKDEGGKITVTPRILLDFKTPLQLQLNLTPDATD